MLGLSCAVRGLLDMMDRVRWIWGRLSSEYVLVSLHRKSCLTVLLRSGESRVIMLHTLFTQVVRHRFVQTAIPDGPSAMRYMCLPRSPSP